MELPVIDGVAERHTLATARGILQLVDLGGLRKGLGRMLEIVQRLDNEGGAEELVLIALLGDNGDGLGAVAAVVGAVPDAGGLGEAEVFVESSGGVDVLVLVCREGDANELDLLIHSHGDYLRRREGHGALSIRLSVIHALAIKSSCAYIYKVLRDIYIDVYVHVPLDWHSNAESNEVWKTMWWMCSKSEDRRHL